MTLRANDGYDSDDCGEIDDTTGGYYIKLKIIT